MRHYTTIQWDSIQYVFVHAKGLTVYILLFTGDLLFLSFLYYTKSTKSLLFKTVTQSLVSLLSLSSFSALSISPLLSLFLQYALWLASYVIGSCLPWTLCGSDLRYPNWISRIAAIPWRAGSGVVGFGFCRWGQRGGRDPRPMSSTCWAATMGPEQRAVG